MIHALMYALYFFGFTGSTVAFSIWMGSIRANNSAAVKLTDAVSSVVLAVFWPISMWLFVSGLVADRTYSSRNVRSIALEKQRKQIEAGIEEAKKATEAYEKALGIGSHAPAYVEITEENEALKQQVEALQATASNLASRTVTQAKEITILRERFSKPTPSESERMIELEKMINDIERRQRARRRYDKGYI